MSDGYIYVFVRQDLSIQDQFVHFGHAIERIVSLHGAESGIPSIITIGIPHEESMTKVRDKLRESQIPHLAWIDPDFKHLGVLSIATVALTKEQRIILSNYRLYDPRANSEHTPVLQVVAGLDAERGANADVAQLREHRTFSPGVVGENPSIGSNLSTETDQ